MKTLLIFFLLSASITTAYGQIDPIDANGLGNGGYDLVSYFKEQKAVEGVSAHKSVHNSITYYFASAENKALFDKDPQAYLPQYDGFCALAVAQWGKKISINPKLFRVKDGKLYLFYHGELYSGDIFNSIEPWLRDESRMIKKADAAWPKVKSKKYAPKS